MEHSKWNYSKLFEKKTLTLKGVITVDCEVGTSEMVKSHNDFCLTINEELNFVDHVDYKILNARRSFHKLKNYPMDNAFQFFFNCINVWCCLSYYVDLPYGHVIFHALLNWKSLSNVVLL